MILKKLAKEPLIHFLFASAALFGVYDAVAPEAVDSSITLSDARKEQIINRFTFIWKREPTEFERKNILEDFLLDEIYAQKGRELGLDIDDSIIKKRLRQKMEFMLFDLAGAVPPKEGELETYYKENAETYKTKDVFAFEYITVSRDASPADTEQFILMNNQRLAQGLIPKGDAEPRVLSAIDSYQASSSFGLAFAQDLAEAEIGEWVGPFDSNYGIHYLKINQFTPGSLPELASVKDKVIDGWRRQKNTEFKENYEREVLAEYRHLIDGQG